MPVLPRYPMAKPMLRLCKMLNLSATQVMRRAGLPPDFLQNEPKGVTGTQFFALWEAMVTEANRPELALELGIAFARGPFVSTLFAFYCSPNIVTGLERLSVFKPLLGPMRFNISHTENSVSLTIRPADPALTIPDSLAAFEMVYFLEASRVSTAAKIVPVSVALPAHLVDQAALDNYFGVPAGLAVHPTLTLTREDAYRPLISENPELWAHFESDLNRQLAERQTGTPISTRVRNALLEMLPSGHSSVGVVCERLIMSRRSLQRKLKDEGSSFQAVLDTTRADLSMHYLRHGEMSVEEISYLLAYRDPNSFYRAFHGWTGMTPAQARRQTLR